MASTEHESTTQERIIPKRQMSYHEFVDKLMKEGKKKEVEARKIASELYFGIEDDHDYQPLGITGISGPPFI